MEEVIPAKRISELAHDAVTALSFVLSKEDGAEIEPKKLEYDRLRVEAALAILAGVGVLSPIAVVRGGGDEA